ncbi:hypothetical protein PPERSA_10972 [Pseudocohnilembus persalinus]|uniref:Uncharacterized protein n=1 Tax=Pseudocohnilembus persalinus TaxID=266149 RepID=A0A0V0QC86_PSEPJ|nr:hypothetical protein PPERSA_10972 [Pseudocohnilembus persalinus]|eukprot:KRW99853.1 hypothetical protein PPERSA_10972 [Pseudocohnilembus persalinus]
MIQKYQQALKNIQNSLNIESQNISQHKNQELNEILELIIEDYLQISKKPTKNQINYEIQKKNLLNLIEQTIQFLDLILEANQSNIQKNALYILRTQEKIFQPTFFQQKFTYIYLNYLYYSAIYQSECLDFDQSIFLLLKGINYQEIENQDTSQLIRNCQYLCKLLQKNKDYDLIEKYTKIMIKAIKDEILLMIDNEQQQNIERSQNLIKSQIKQKNQKIEKRSIQIIICLINLSEVYQIQQKKSQIIDEYKEILKSFEFLLNIKEQTIVEMEDFLNFVEQIIDTLFVLSETQLQLHNHVAAMQNLEKAKLIIQDILPKDNSRQKSKLQEKVELKIKNTQKIIYNSFRPIHFQQKEIDRIYQELQKLKKSQHYQPLLIKYKRSLLAVQFFEISKLHKNLILRKDNLQTSLNLINEFNLTENDEKTLKLKKQVTKEIPEIEQKILFEQENDQKLIQQLQKLNKYTQNLTKLTQNLQTYINETKNKYAKYVRLLAASYCNLAQQQEKINDYLQAEHNYCNAFYSIKQYIPEQQHLLEIYQNYYDEFQDKNNIKNQSLYQTNIQYKQQDQSFQDKSERLDYIQEQFLLQNNEEVLYQNSFQQNQEFPIPKMKNYYHFKPQK